MEGGEVHTGFWWGKPEGNGPLGRYMRRWDNTKVNLKEAVWQDVDWTLPALGRDKQQAAVKSVMKHRVWGRPSPAMERSVFQKILSCLVKTLFYIQRNGCLEA